MPLIQNSGFPPSVFLLEEADEASNGANQGSSSLQEAKRYLLISNPDKTLDIHKKRKRRKRTKNRKTVSKSMKITHEGVEYNINNAPTYGVYPEIFHKGMEQLNICLSMWKRVFVIRFDLHQHFHTSNNAMVSRFRDNLVRRIERAYSLFKIGYIWVREQEKANRQHYHFALFLDGDKVNHSAIISETIRETWEAVKVGNSVHIPKSCYYNLHIDDDEAMGEFVYRLSYLSKQRGKGYRQPQTKDFSTSRLIKPHGGKFHPNQFKEL